MKKVWMWAVALLMVATAEAQERQTKGQQEKTISLIDSTDADPTAQLLRRSENRGELVLAVGGQQITLGSPKKRGTVDTKSMLAVKKTHFAFGLSALEFGFSLLPSIDYAGFAPAEQGFMDQRVGKSIHFGWRVLGLDVQLNRTRTISFSTGLSVAWDNYRFDPVWSLDRVDGKIVPVALEQEMKKSKLATCQLGIPVGIRFVPMRHMELCLFGYGELVTDSWVKVAKPKTKHDITGLNDVRFGVQVVATYRNVGFFYKHSFTPLFKSDVGPKCYPISVGLAWGF